MYLIGSRAAKFWDPNFPRAPKDWDLIATVEEFNAFMRYRSDKVIYSYPSSPTKYQVKLNSDTKLEVELITSDTSNAMLNDLCKARAFQDNNKYATCYLDYTWPLTPVPQILLYLIKRSHIYWDVHWYKNIEDLHYLMSKIQDIVLEPTEREFYIKRLTENGSKFGKKLIKLNTNNEEFFDRSESKIHRIYEHDDLHEAIKFGIMPAFKMAKADPTSALMSKVLFDKLPDHIKIQTVREEATVIALERKIIPFLRNPRSPSGTPSPHMVNNAYRWALKRVCTNLTSGWFRDFAINSWPITKDPGQDFIGRVNRAIEAGTLKTSQQKREIMVA